MAVLAVIPARGGSKRVPGKNLRKVGGVSLVARAIRDACQSREVTHVVVTSDHPDIRDEAYTTFLGQDKKGKEIFIIPRPKELATDKASLDAAVVHATRYVNGQISPSQVDMVVTLQPTSPLRPAGMIDEMVQTLRAHPSHNSIISVHKAGHFFWQQDGTHPTVTHRFRQVNARDRKQSQDILPKDQLWAENGACYVTDAYALLCTAKRTIFHTLIHPIPMPHAVDIDTEEDFQLAEGILNALQSRGENT